MKKLFLVAFVLLSTSVFAQQKDASNIGVFSLSGKADGNTGLIAPNSDPTNTPGSGARTTPLAPATLLLLGLGGATVGTAVCRNQKKRK